MRHLFRSMIAVGLALAATPALALTYVPSSAVPSGRQFADPDAALDNMSSSLRDGVIENNLLTPNESQSVDASYFDGGVSSDSGDRPPTRDALIQREDLVSAQP